VCSTPCVDALGFGDGGGSGLAGVPRQAQPPVSAVGRVVDVAVPSSPRPLLFEKERKKR
jgi:hypothetical protein